MSHAAKSVVVLSTGEKILSSYSAQLIRASARDAETLPFLAVPVAGTWTAERGTVFRHVNVVHVVEVRLAGEPEAEG